jgi:hypothetical protein
MNAARPLPLPDPPRGFRYYHSQEEILRASELFAYQHMLLRAWDDMHLSGVLTLNGIPTVYVREEDKPVTAKTAAEAHRQFWNQGVATILLLRDPREVRVFSSMTKPANPDTATDADMEQRLVEKLDLATQASWAQRFYIRLGTGHYYGETRVAKFDPEQTVDAYLLTNLAAVRDALLKHGLEPRFAHAFLGRLLFTCYLCDRGIIELPNYFKSNSWQRLHELLTAFEDPRPALYETLFPALNREFNGSMFDDDLSAERALIRPEHFEVVRRFLHGDDMAKGRGQRSLGFWAYDFKFIPVETISAIYENFLESEDGEGKHAAGAFYTPRFLAEMALDIALEKTRPLYTETRRFLDPACGSGIFLVLLFNRLAAEWRAAQQSEPTPQAKAEALLERLSTLRGIDKNATACGIACFSLYLAFLDQFNPPDVRAYKLHTGKKLPNLLYLDGAKRVPEYPIIREADFFSVAGGMRQQFDLVIGNPPWAGRGSKQVAHQFMEDTPDIVKKTGRVCLLLPSKVFLNQTDAFQARWLRRVTLEKVIQLADFSFILFKEALCPCNIALFSGRKPDESTHEIEYVAPKVSRADLRDGVIQVAPHDRKWIPLRLILAAAEQKAISVAWKSHLWGTPRDLKFLDYLFTFPRLGDLAGSVGEFKRGEKRWCKGQGFQPLRVMGKTDKPQTMQWPPSDTFVTPELIDDLFVLPASLTYKLGPYLKLRGYRLDKLHRARDERIYKGPLVLWNQGFSTAAFFEYRVRFQHSLQSIAGVSADADLLLWLSVVLRSNFARYFVFQTAANLGTERDKVHMPEVLRLPFFLPDSEASQPDAAEIVTKAAAKIRRLKQQMEDGAETLLEGHKRSKYGPLFGDDDEHTTEAEEIREWLGRQRGKARKLQAELTPLVYKYFGLSQQEQALIEDTCEIFDRSDTPASLEAARNIPTLQPLEAAGLEPYALMLTDTLNGWSTGRIKVCAVGGVDPELGLGLVELSQTSTHKPFYSRDISQPLAMAFQQLQEANIDHWGRFEFRRSGLIFDNDHSRIYLLKPALRGQWTRNAALNDAVELSAHIAEARLQARNR